MGKSSAPPAPDYEASARATAEGNLANARAQTTANRVDTYTPYGNLTYTNGRTFDQGGYDAAMQQYTTQRGQGATAGTPGTMQYVGNGTDAGDGNGGWQMTGGTPGTPGFTGQAPNREDFYSGDPDKWEARIQLDPAQQQLLDQQNQTSLGLSALQNQGVQRVGDAMSQPFNSANLPGAGQAQRMQGMYQPQQNQFAPYQSQGAPQGYQDGRYGVSPTTQGGNSFQGMALPGAWQGQATPGTYNQVQGAGTYDPSQAPGLSNYYDPQADTNNATEAILSRVNPQLQQDRRAMETQLANQGITQGSEAWNNAQTQMGQKENDARTQASLQGINLGMAQQGQNFGQSVQGINTGLAQQGQQYGQQYGNINQGMAQQGQQYGQQMGNLNNIMAQQGQQYGQQANNIGLNMGQYSQGLQGQNQAFNQGLQSAQFGLGQQNQAYGQAANNLGMNMQQQAQGFNQSGQNIAQNMAQQGQQWNQGIQGQDQYFNQSNAARQQALQEQAYLRNLPLNELNALRTGAQVTNPSFQNAPQQQYTPGPDLMGAQTNQYNAAMQGVNASNANSASTAGALGTVATIAASMF